jgi:hypothetical protein
MRHRRLSWRSDVPEYSKADVKPGRQAEAELIAAAEREAERAAREDDRLYLQRWAANRAAVSERLAKGTK